MAGRLRHDDGDDIFISELEQSYEMNNIPGEGKDISGYEMMLWVLETRSAHVSGNGHAIQIETVVAHSISSPLSDASSTAPFMSTVEPLLRHALCKA